MVVHKDWRCKCAMTGKTLTAADERVKFVGADGFHVHVEAATFKNFINELRGVKKGAPIPGITFFPDVRDGIVAKVNLYDLVRGADPLIIEQLSKETDKRVGRAISLTKKAVVREQGKQTVKSRKRFDRSHSAATTVSA